METLETNKVYPLHDTYDWYEFTLSNGETFPGILEMVPDKASPMFYLIGVSDLDKLKEAKETGNHKVLQQIRRRVDIDDILRYKHVKIYLD